MEEFWQIFPLLLLTTVTNTKYLIQSRLTTPSLTYRPSARSSELGGQRQRLHLPQVNFLSSRSWFDRFSHQTLVVEYCGSSCRLWRVDCAGESHFWHIDDQLVEQRREKKWIEEKWVLSGKTTKGFGEHPGIIAALLRWCFYEIISLCGLLEFDCRWQTSR